MNDHIEQPRRGVPHVNVGVIGSGARRRPGALLSLLALGLMATGGRKSVLPVATAGMKMPEVMTLKTPTELEAIEAAKAKRARKAARKQFPEGERKAAVGTLVIHNARGVSA